MKEHELYISRCLQLAKQGTFAALPNPSVGAVIVHNNKIIGEGYTSAYGGSHAEPNAIQHVKDQSLLERSTLYVSLEPCSHFGKTPPCCDLIIEKKIPKVVIGTIDPFAKVCGRGISKMREAGIEVIVGVLQKECQKSNIRFFTFHQQRRPYIILKWAETQDGYLAPLTKEEKRPFWISNQYSKQLVHQWRSEEAAFLVGTQTVKDDNPSLTTRNWYGKNPTRVFIDRQGVITKDFHLFDGLSKTICITSNRSLINSSAVVQYEYADFENNLLEQICTILHKHQIISVVIEGGSFTLQSFIDNDLWDEARIFIGNTLLHEGVEAPKLKNISTIEQLSILSDTLKTVYPIKK